MPLQGKLPEINVVDVLHLLSLASKTGVVRFSREQGPVTQNGALYFRDGNVVAVESDSLVGEQALEMLCSWDSGGFVYHDGVTSPRENVATSIGQLVDQASAAMDEWREVHRAFPNPSASVRPASELAPGRQEVRLDSEEWGFLARMSRTQPLVAWAQQGGGGLQAYRTLRKLAEDGLLKLEG